MSDENINSNVSLNYRDMKYSLPGLSFLRMKIKHSKSSFLSSSSNEALETGLLLASKLLPAAGAEEVTERFECLDGAGEFLPPPVGLTRCWRVDKRLSSMNGWSRLLWKRSECSSMVVRYGMYKAAILACFSWRNRNSFQSVL